MDVTVVVATFGSSWWRDLAQSRAVPSAEATGAQVIHTHGPTLHEARNAGLDRVDTEHVIHLDADDELEPGYLDAMRSGTADVRAPMVRYMRGGAAQTPWMPRVFSHTHDCAAACLPQGNWLVVGAMARTDLLREVGGWHDHPVYEDWDLWLRCHLTGASIEAIPTAIYRAHVRDDSRNRGSVTAEVKHATHRAIAAANGIEAP